MTSVGPTKPGESNDDDSKLIFGTVFSLRNMVRKLGGDDDRYCCCASFFFFLLCFQLDMVHLSGPAAENGFSANIIPLI